jgi:hypothetical protein
MARTAFGSVEAGMGPEDARLGVLGQHALDGFAVAVQVQPEAILPRQLDHAPHHRQIGVGTEDMELADRRVAMLLQPLLDMADHGFVA